MAIAVITESLWKCLFKKKKPERVSEQRKDYSSAAKRSRDAKVYRLRNKGRAFHHRKGPGRKTKRVKNSFVTRM